MVGAGLEVMTEGDGGFRSGISGEIVSGGHAGGVYCRTYRKRRYRYDEVGFLIFPIVSVFLSMGDIFLRWFINVPDRPHCRNILCALSGAGALSVLTQDAETTVTEAQQRRKDVRPEVGIVSVVSKDPKIVTRGVAMDCALGVVHRRFFSIGRL